MKLFKKIILLLLLPVVALSQENPLFKKATKKQADSLQIVVKQTKNDTTKMAALRDLCFYYLDIYSDSALYFIEQEVPIAKRLQLKLWESDAIDLHGLLLANVGNYPASLKEYSEAINLADDKESEKNIWNISRFTNNNDPQTARLNMLASVKLDLSELYNITASPDKAVTILKECIAISLLNKDETITSLANRRLGEIYAQKGNMDSALNFFQLSLSYLERAGYEKYRGETLNQIGLLYLKQQHFELAKKYFNDAIISNGKMNNKNGLGIAFISLAELYMGLGNFDSSYYYAKKGEAYTISSGRRSYVLSAYSTLAKLFEMEKKPDSAFIYLQLMVAIKDSLNNAQKLKQFQNIGFDEELRSQELEKEKIQTQNKIRTYAMLAGLLMVLVVALLLYSNNRHKQKANKLLEQTLSDLKATQSQLIQSEKMASLGELTAGIAHEIQNPLNFVNNFSDVNTELIDEVKQEMEKGNLDEAKLILNDVKENEQKINHHGKRADAIVKGMLQHSRSSSGQKELTDINKLADEYLRLAYHGSRAKDRSFNATIKTDYDESIGNISIIPQDIGRVILNLITNAFYAVAEKRKQDIAGYEPTVSVSTKKLGDKVEVKVKDNGSGIPSKVLDKIFQPFFTTKPTGEGTGLGLSLSYDIVKAHGGKLNVETWEEKGTEFIILLPDVRHS